MNEHAEEQTIITARLVQTVRSNNFDAFKTLVENSPEKFRSLIQNDSGLLLLREVVRENRKDFFHYMLQFQDTERRKTTLRFMLDFHGNEQEYFIYELIKNGVLIHEEYKHRNLLHWSIGKSWLDLTKFLLEAGVDPNLRDNFDNTPLHKILLKSPCEDDCEFVSVLLYYGADPVMETFEGYNAFELAILKQHSILTQELLFHYTFDEHTHLEIFSHILFTLAKKKSPLFHKLLSYNIEGVVKHTPKFFSTLRDLLTIDLQDLQLLLEKNNSMVCEIFEKCNTEILYRSEWPRDMNNFFHLWQNGIYIALEAPNVLTNLNYICENSDVLCLSVQNFCANLDSWSIFERLVNNSAADSSEVLSYMLTKGLRVDRNVLDLVFNNYGYSQLFKLLLHFEHESNKTQHYSENTKNAVVTLICDIDLDLDGFFRNLDYHSRGSVVQLLDYCAHFELTQFLTNLSSSGKLSEEVSKRVRNHPRIPRLLELSRNVFRKYLVKTFNIESTNQFYATVNALPVGCIYKKIIALEVKPYLIVE